MAVNVRAVVLVWCAFAFLTWIVALAGMSAVTRDCYRALDNDNCVRGLQYEWWGVWFEFVMIIIIAAVAFMNRLEMHQLTLLTFIAILTSILTWSARSVMVNGSYVDLVSNREAAKHTAAAGFVLLCIANFLLILLLGSAGRINSNYFTTAADPNNPNPNGTAGVPPGTAGEKYRPPSVINQGGQPVAQPFAIRAGAGHPAPMNPAPVNPTNTINSANPGPILPMR